VCSPRTVRRVPSLSVLTTGALADVLAVASLTAMGVGAADLVRHGRLSGRLLLVAGALVWPFPEHPLQGPVIVDLSYLHGVHASDLLSLVALALAVTWPPERGSASRRAGRSSRGGDQRPAR
jgi:hypothetical protein